MTDNGSKARKASSTLNRRGWAFTRMEELSTVRTFVALDRFSDIPKRAGVAVLFDLDALTANVYAFQGEKYSLTSVPEPSPKHPTIVVPLRADSGGIAWANDIEKALAVFKA